ITGYQDRPASLLARDLGQRKTVLVSRLGYIDDHDVVIVVVERLAHFRSGLDHRETKTLVVENVAQQVTYVVIVFDNQHLANPRHLSPSSEFRVGRFSLPRARLRA